jgi:hypothetical protein
MKTPKPSSNHIVAAASSLSPMALDKALAVRVDRASSKRHGDDDTSALVPLINESVRVRDSLR